MCLALTTLGGSVTLIAVRHNRDNVILIFFPLKYTPEINLSSELIILLRIEFKIILRTFCSLCWIYIAENSCNEFLTCY